LVPALKNFGVPVLQPWVKMPYPPRPIDVGDLRPTLGMQPVKELHDGLTVGELARQISAFAPCFVENWVLYTYIII